MALAPSAFAGGFVDPVFGSQAVFAAAMRALAAPGTVHDFGSGVQAPGALEPAAAAFLAAMADEDAPVWLDPLLGGRDEAADWIAFQTGARAAGHAEAAHLAVLARGTAQRLDAFSAGTDAYPDRSATVLVAVEALDGGGPLVLAGPGIETTRTIAPIGLPSAFFDDWAANRRLFPRGVDALLVCGTLAVGLPRTTRITRA